MNSWVSKIWLRPSGVIVGLAGLVALQDGFFEIASVKGPSMSPTLSPAFHETGARDLVLLSKWTLKWNAKLERGQIVGFRPPHNPDKVSIKRIIALEGDIVFPQVRQAPSQRYPEQEVVVPKGHVWVEGDNWRLTKDSNDYGPISQKLILSVATHVLWPKWRELLPDDGFRPHSKVVQGDPSLAPNSPYAEGVPLPGDDM